MELTSISTYPNLFLAWRRITTGTNARYKQYFRPLYEAYELSHKENLQDLRRRIRDGTFSPSTPYRIYYPKPSGLQRPVSLLALEDQILLQAIANLFVRSVRSSRAPFENQVVFSNGLQAPKSRFLFRDWRKGYRALRARLQGLYDKGFIWHASLDLSAFYDTISHTLLMRTIAPRGGSQELVDYCLECLEMWSSPVKSAQYSHGIPQGPIASSLLAEVFMMPIDEKMGLQFKFARYVDDVNIMGKSEIDVLRGVASFDKLCRDRGLIPNTSKYDLVKLKGRSDVNALVALLEGYPIPWSRGYQSKEHSKKLVVGALNKSRRQVDDKSKFRYAFFRAPKSRYLLRAALRLWGSYPEHTDAFVAFFENYTRSKPVVDYCVDQLAQEPIYDYVCGELWTLIARMGAGDEMRPLIDEAIATVKASRDRPWSALGSLVFLCSAQKKGLGNYARFLRWIDEPLLQSLAGPHLPVTHSSIQDVIESYASRSIPDPAVSLTRVFVAESFSLDTALGAAFNYHPVVENIYIAAGLIQRPPRRPPDPLRILIAKRFGIIRWPSWQQLLRAEYQHAHHFFVLADANFPSQYSTWLGLQDSFNEIVIRAFQDLLAANQHGGAINMVDARGDLVSYGSILNNPNFANAHPVAVSNLAKVHRRRNSVPSSHPYDKKTGQKARPLRKQERNSLVRYMTHAYSEIIAVCQQLGL
ncbi:MAG: reverse transcriptase domain-containing protein [Anaerolineales bacterium]